MEATTRPRVKICCIASREEAWKAIRAGASALGLVSAMPSGEEGSSIRSRGRGAETVLVLLGQLVQGAPEDHVVPRLVRMDEGVTQPSRRSGRVKASKPRC